MYVDVLDALHLHSLYLHFSNQSSIYAPLLFHLNSKYFMQATTDVYTQLSCNLLAAKNI